MVSLKTWNNSSRTTSTNTGQRWETIKSKGVDSRDCHSAPWSRKTIRDLKLGRTSKTSSRTSATSAEFLTHAGLLYFGRRNLKWLKNKGQTQPACSSTSEGEWPMIKISSTISSWGLGFNKPNLTKNCLKEVKGSGKLASTCWINNSTSTMPILLNSNFFQTSETRWWDWTCRGFNRWGYTLYRWWILLHSKATRNSFCCSKSWA